MFDNLRNSIATIELAVILIGLVFYPVSCAKGKIDNENENKNYKIRLQKSAEFKRIGEYNQLIDALLSYNLEEATEQCSNLAEQPYKNSEYLIKYVHILNILKTPDKYMDAYEDYQYISKEIPQDLPDALIESIQDTLYSYKNVYAALDNK